MHGNFIPFGAPGTSRGQSGESRASAERRETKARSIVPPPNSSSPSGSTSSKALRTSLPSEIGVSHALLSLALAASLIVHGAVLLLPVSWLSSVKPGLTSSLPTASVLRVFLVPTPIGASAKDAIAHSMQEAAEPVSRLAVEKRPTSSPASVPAPQIESTATAATQHSISEKPLAASKARSKTRWQAAIKVWPKPQRQLAGSAQFRSGSRTTKPSDLPPAPAPATHPEHEHLAAATLAPQDAARSNSKDETATRSFTESQVLADAAQVIANRNDERFTDVSAPPGEQETAQQQDQEVAQPRANSEQNRPLSQDRVAAMSPTTVTPSSPAAYLDNPRPDYPVSAREDGQHGLVVLRVLVSETGEPSKLKIQKSSGYAALDAAAMAGVKRWLFTPARRDRQSIASWIDVPIRFRLDEDDSQ